MRRVRGLCQSAECTVSRQIGILEVRKVHFRIHFGKRLLQRQLQHGKQSPEKFIGTGGASRSESLGKDFSLNQGFQAELFAIKVV